MALNVIINCQMFEKIRRKDNLFGGGQIFRGGGGGGGNDKESLFSITFSYN